MGDPPRSPTVDFYSSILGISKSPTVKEMCKAYKTLVMKLHPDKNPSNKSEAQAKFQQINEAYKALNAKKIKESTKRLEYEPTPLTPKDIQSPGGSNYHHPTPKDIRSPGGSNHHHKSMEDSFFSRSTVLLKSLSKKYRTPSPSPTYLSKSSSRRSTSPVANTSRSKSTSRRSISPAPDTSRSKSTCRGSISSAPDTSWSKSTSRRSASDTEFSPLYRSPTLRGNTPIIYSQSTARKKPPPVERKLECTLEELCHGCIKKIKITRNVIPNGIIEQEEEILKVRVKPGWKKGTKITFEGKGDERPGYNPADIILLIDEKRHPLFQREGDDLEYGLEIPLIQALTGCSISVPLIGGEKMCLTFDEIIYPGFEKVIPGQGMPTKAEGKRGDLRIKFFVEFPTDLSDEQRAEASSILLDCS